jgi:flagellar basal-body rod modification protein FlgD
MTALSALSAVTTSTTAAPSAAGLGGMDYNAFLKLLIAQLKNQDPTQPMDNTEFVSQLATFSQVEQSIDVNKKLDSMLTSQSLTLADAVIGHKVTSPDGKITGVVKSVVITSDGPVAKLDNGKYLFLGNGIIIE